MDHASLVAIIFGTATTICTIIGGYARLEGRLVAIETTITNTHKIEIDDMKRRLQTLEDRLNSR